MSGAVSLGIVFKLAGVWLEVLDRKGWLGVHPCKAKAGLRVSNKVHINSVYLIIVNKHK